MPTLESLPRELLQQIFFYAFDDAAASDAKFHDNIYNCLWNNKDQRSRLIESYEMPECLKEALQHDKINEEEDEEDYYSPSNNENTYAPYLNDLASNLCLVFPDLRDDVIFVLEKAMNKAYEENGTGIDERKEAQRHCWSAVYLYASGAEEKQYTHDDGEYVYLLAKRDAKGWKWITPKGFVKEQEHQIGNEWNDWNNWAWEWDWEGTEWIPAARSVHCPYSYNTGYPSIDGYYGPGFKRQVEAG